MPDSRLFDVVDKLPRNLMTKAGRVGLHRLAESLDGLLFLDSTENLCVDRAALIELASDEEFVPSELRSIVLVETAKHLGHHLKERKDGTPVSWTEAAKFGLPVQALSDDAIAGLGLRGGATADDVERAVREHLKDVPDFWIRDDTRSLVTDIKAQYAVNRTVWDCLVRNLGWWAAITVIGSLIIFLMLLGNAVPWPVALAIAIVYSGVSTAYFIAQCTANPEYQA